MNQRRDQIGTSLAWGAWTLAQVAWLAVSAERVGLSAKWPAAGERWAAMGMVAVQLVLACAMGRWLLRDLRTALSAIAVATPMLGLALVQSGMSVSGGVGAMMCVAAWLGAAASVGSIHRPAIRTPMTALLTLLAAGAPVMLYLSWEFGRRVVSADGVIAIVSPVLGAASSLSHAAPRPSLFIAPLLLTVAILLGRGLVRRRAVRPPIPPTRETLTGLVG